jgi:hypothetical protein
VLSVEGEFAREGEEAVLRVGWDIGWAELEMVGQGLGVAQLSGSTLHA